MATSTVHLSYVILIETSFSLRRGVFLSINGFRGWLGGGIAGYSDAGAACLEDAVGSGASEGEGGKEGDEGEDGGIEVHDTCCW